MALIMGCRGPVQDSAEKNAPNVRPSDHQTTRGTPLAARSTNLSKPGSMASRPARIQPGAGPAAPRSTAGRNKAATRQGEPDMMDLALVPVRIPPPVDAASVTYEVDTHSKAVIPSDTYQAVKTLGPHRYLVTIRRPDYRHLPHQRLGAVSAHGKMAEFLKATPSLQTRSHILRALAHKALAGIHDAAKAAMALTWFTYRYIVHKGYSLPAATALDVARLKRGDCSEHAFLLAALGRIVGLPSRVASGLIFTPTFNEHRNVFVYHMWTEFLIGGTWIPFDGTRPQPGVGPTHIVIATDSLTAMFPMAATTALLQALGKIRIKVRTRH